MHEWLPGQPSQHLLGRICEFLLVYFIIIILYVFSWNRGESIPVFGFKFKILVLYLQFLCIQWLLLRRSVPFSEFLYLF